MGRESEQTLHCVQPRLGVFPASLLQSLGQRLRIAQDAATMVSWMYQVFGEQDACGVTRLEMCPRMAVSLPGISMAP